MPDPPWELGDTVRVQTALTSASTGSAVVASSIELRVKNPLGTVATYASVGASPPQALASGIYYVDYVLPYVGSYAWRWEASGPVTAEEGTFSTATSRF